MITKVHFYYLIEVLCFATVILTTINSEKYGPQFINLCFRNYTIVNYLSVSTSIRIFLNYCISIERVPPSVFLNVQNPVNEDRKYTTISTFRFFPPVFKLT